MEEYSVFEGNIHYLLYEKKFDDILNIINDSENDSLVSKNVWNIINLAYLTVKTNNLLKTENNVQICRKILVLLVNRGNPKKVLLSLLERSDWFKHDEFFCLLLEPLQVALKKIPGKRGKSLQWILSTLNAHIETLNNPDDINLFDVPQEQEVSPGAELDIQDTAYILAKYLDFIQFFVDEISFENLKSKEIYYYDRICNQQEILQKYILKLFHHPFLYHHFSFNFSMPKSSMHVLCEGFVNCLSKICHNVFNLFKYDDMANKTNSMEIDNGSISLLAFSNLSYLIFVEEMVIAFQPFVYTHCFIFLTYFKYVIPLLKRTENVVLFKGFKLAQILMEQLDDLQLNYNFKDQNVFVEFPKLLLGIINDPDIFIDKSVAEHIFSKFSKKLNYKGQYYLIMQMLSSTKHSNIEVMINLYQDNLSKALTGCEPCNFFLGENLFIFLKKVCVLSEGNNTDINEYKKTFSVLRHLHYILTNDPMVDDVTGVWLNLDYICEYFLKPLICWIDYHKAHCKENIELLENYALPKVDGVPPQAAIMQKLKQAWNILDETDNIRLNVMHSIVRGIYELKLLFKK